MKDPYFFGQADEIGQQVHLLFDEHAIEDRWNVTRVLNSPIKHPKNPVLVPDMPWEEQLGAPSVLFDPQAKMFHMWYASYNTQVWTRGKLKGERVYGAYMMSYATSANGVDWTKPLFDKYPLRDWDETNIVYTGEHLIQGFDVTYTPAPMRKHGRFMVVYKDGIIGESDNIRLATGTDDLCIAFSDNGLDWRAYEKNPICPVLDIESSLLWDERQGIWLHCHRPFARAANEAVYTGQNTRTRIAVSVSEDLENWHMPREVLCPDNEDDDNRMFFDHMTMDRYGRQYLGFLASQSRDGTGGGHIEVVGSLDGMHWHRSAEKTPFLAPGEPGQWDAGLVWCIKNVVPYGNWLYMYYAASQRPWRYRLPANPKGIGMARIRRDRFAGYHGDVNGGYVLSREVKVTGEKLIINCAGDHRAFNQITHGKTGVELIAHDGLPIKDYTLEDCDVTLANDCSFPVTWKGRDISALKGGNVFVRFVLTSSHIFAFRFAD